MPTYLTPGVYFESADQGSQATTALRTDIASFIGVAQKGPLQTPTAVNSWEQFQTTFGSFLPNAYLAYSAKAFFENGGQKLYCIRVAAPPASTATDPSAVQPGDGAASIVLSVAGFAAGALVTAQQTVQATTVGTQPTDRSSSLVDTVTGFPEGSLVEISQTVPVAVRSFRKVRAVDSVTKRLFWDSALDSAFVFTQPIQLAAFQHADFLVRSIDTSTITLQWSSPLGPAFNTTQSIQFSTGAWPSQGDLVDSNGTPTVHIQAASAGVWGDGLAIHVSQASPAAATTTSAPQPPSGTASLVSSIVGFARGALVKVFQPGVPAQYRSLAGADPSTNLLIWDLPLEAPLDLTKQLYFETIEFGLTVYLNGKAQEIFTGLSLDPRHAGYVASAVGPGASRFILATDLHSATPYPGHLPDPGAPQLDAGVLSLWGGRDGIAGLRAGDFTGDPSSSSRWGLRTLEQIEEISIVSAADILIEPAPAVLHEPPAPPKVDPCLPGSKSPARAQPSVPFPVEATPRFSLDEVFRVQQALVSHCEAVRYRVAILDSPDFGYPQQRVDLGEVQSWRNRFDSKYAALYFPWILVREPLPSTQVVRRIPPSGHVAGVYANMDLTVGVHHAPANVQLQWAQDVTTEISGEMQGVLNPLGVDCIRAFPGRGLRVYGARTVSSDIAWRFINVRRLFCMIERALEMSLQWAVFEPNNFYLWQKMRLSIGSFLETLWKKGALVGNTREDAFFVKCDLTNNPLPVASAGQVIAEVGAAPAQPAEFVVFRIGRTEDTLEVTEAS